MEVEEKSILKWKRIHNQYLYLLQITKDLYCVLLNDSDDFTTVIGEVYFDYVDSLHRFNELKGFIMKNN